VKRLLVAVDDSADSLAAARLAIDLAMALHAQLRVIHVSADHLIDATVAAASGLPAVAERRAQAGRAVPIPPECRPRPNCFPATPDL
jgi:nucleotide-binding universal stress UspA family protein